MSNSLFKYRVLSFLILIGIFLLTVNIRINQDDEISILAAILRPNSFFAIALLFGGVFAGGLIFKRIAKRMVVYSLLFLPITYFFLILLASVKSFFDYGVIYNYLGFYDLLNIFFYIIFGFFFYNFLTYSETRKVLVVRFLLFTPLFNLLVICIWFIFPLDNFLGSLSLFNEGYSIVGLGGRLQVIASNPNIIAVQTSIAFAIALPTIFSANYNNVLKRSALAFYLLTLVAMIIWTGSRAALLSISLLLILFIWLNRRNFTRSILGVISLMLVVIFTWGFVNFYGVEIEVLSRFSSQEDGRLFIWSYYIDLILENLLGYGIGFEAIVDTTSLREGQRLTAHNALIMSAIYAGLIGLLVNILIIFYALNIGFRNNKKNSDSLGVLLAFIGIIINYFFGGNYIGDPNFTILLALILAEYTRIRKKNLPVFFNTRKA